MSEEKEKKADPKETKAEKNQAPQAAPVMGGIAARAASKTKWTLTRCKRFARRYHSEQEWEAGAPSSYKSALANGWMKECAKEFIKDNVLSLTKVNEELAKRIDKQSA